MSSGGIRASIDARTGGPARRRRRMMRRLEELDRLDLRARSPEEVLWPGRVSSRQDPRAWAPAADTRRHRAGPWWVRSPTWGVAVVVVTLALTIAGPSRLLHLLPDLLPARAERPADAQVPTRSDEASDERLLPAVVMKDVPNAETFAWMQTQGDGTTPVTFDPCRPVHYVTRSIGPTTDDVSVIEKAVATVSAASGLQFVYDGPTNERPSEGRAPFQPDTYGDRWAPVLVAWTHAGESPELAEKAGLGGGIPWRDTSGRVSYVSGTVWLDADSLVPLMQEAGGRERVSAVVVHELTHVLGATHPRATDQLMSVKGKGRTDLGPGDRFALSVLGQGKCVPGL